MIKRTLREQIQQLQRPEKRSRREILAAADESTLPFEGDPIQQPRGDENEENVEPATVIEFQRGVTQKGGMCLWFNGYRYLRRVKTHFYCPFLGCRQTAIIDSEEEDGRLMGRIGGTEHNHSAEPSRKYAEAARQVMKLETESRGGRRLKAAKVLSAARVGLNDEAFFMVGSDEALARMMRREKAKVFSKVNLRNPLLIELPEQLLIYEGQSMLSTTAAYIVQGRVIRFLFFRTQNCWTFSVSI
uniref:FLYWCH-type domain-containing protein n=1 Tax=Globodera rostochiensis TaxID=31243 RepID=A0A914HEN4_GLORO